MGRWRLRISLPRTRRSRLARFRSGAAVSLLLLASPPGHAAPFSDPQFQTVSIRHIAAKIRVDGRLDEPVWSQDRKSTRLNSSHSQISYAVFCLKKKKKK